MEEGIRQESDKAVEVIQSKEQKERRIEKCEDHLRDTIKWTNICVTVLQEREGKKGQKAYSKK